MPPAEARSMREQLDEAWNKGSREEEEEEEVVAAPEEEEQDGDVEAGGPEEDSEKPVRTAEEKEAEPEDGDKEPEKKAGGDEKDRPADKKSDKADSSSGGDKKAAKDDGELKAPASWKPATREHWKSIPKEAQAEIIRREREIDTGLQQASAYKKVANEYFNVIKPYEHLIRAQNSTPSQAITNMMQTAARLVQGTRQQKAACVAEIMKNYDVDVKTLDDILVGTVKPGDDPDAKISDLVKVQLSPVLEFINEVKGSRAQAEQKGQEEVSTSFQTFSEDPKNEFFQDVREDMADLMEMAANRGQAMTLEQAYARACQMNTEVSKILSQREIRKNGELTNQQLLRKKKAASSIKGSPDDTLTTQKDSGDLRSSILQAMDDLDAQ